MLRGRQKPPTNLKPVYLVRPSRERARADLYARLAGGAKIYSKAIQLFESNPDTPIQKIFAETAQMENLTRNQKRFLLESLRRLKLHQKIVRSIAKEISADELIGSYCQQFGIPFEPNVPGRPKAVLETNPFGLVLKMDSATFSQIAKAIFEHGMAPVPDPNAQTTYLSWPLRNGEMHTIPVAWMTHSQGGGVFSAHEKRHMRLVAVGAYTSRSVRPQSKKEIREDLFGDLKTEITAHVAQGDLIGLNAFLRAFVRTRAPDIKNCLSQAEIAEMDRLIFMITKKALPLMPREELLALMEMTPITKWNKRIGCLIEKKD
ncbi:MAG: hypothetical protein V1493_01145 [Candidatus Diapherotrites archaeon]